MISSSSREGSSIARHKTLAAAKIRDSVLRVPDGRGRRSRKEKGWGGEKTSANWKEM